MKQQTHRSNRRVVTTMRWLAFGASLLLISETGRGATIDEATLFSRSLASHGDVARLQRALAKARRGESVTIGVIGGSITQGAAASQPEKRYGNLVAEWWKRSFPKAKVEFVNAGIGATGSDYGALRAQRDLLSHRPDLVIVEYAVNDPDTELAAETLEGLVRQILKQPNEPAALLLFMMNQSGGNAQNSHSRIGRHYHLPMISMRDALWPEIEQGRMKWSDVEADAVHPNDRGHDYCARFVIHLLEEVSKQAAPQEISPLPSPLISDLFEHVALMEADALQPSKNVGWVLEAKSSSGKCWKAEQPGNTIEFEVIGKALLVMDWHLRGPMGQARVQVDDLPPVVREGWFDQTWGGYRMTSLLARDLKPGKHRVKLELISEKNPQSTGHEFQLLGLGLAGVEVR